MRIWTLKKPSPFHMGGDLSHYTVPISTDAEPIESHEVGGHTLHLIKHPDKERYYVAEGETGAFVGHGEIPNVALAMTVADLATADPEILEEQMKYARKMIAEAEHLTPERFWAHLK